MTTTTFDRFPALAAFRKADPGLETCFKQAYGFTVFPTIGKGGFWFGGAMLEASVGRQDFGYEPGLSD